MVWTSIHLIFWSSIVHAGHACGFYNDHGKDPLVNDTSMALNGSLLVDGSTGSNVSVIDWFLDPLFLLPWTRTKPSNNKPGRLFLSKLSKQESLMSKIKNGTKTYLIDCFFVRLRIRLRLSVLIAWISSWQWLG